MTSANYRANHLRTEKKKIASIMQGYQNLRIDQENSRGSQNAATKSAAHNIGRKANGRETGKNVATT